MARARHLQGLPIGVDDRVQQCDHAALLALEHEAVHPLQNHGGPQSLQGIGAQGALQVGHPRRRLDAATDHVSDRDPELAAAQRDRVVPVARRSWSRRSRADSGPRVAGQAPRAGAAKGFAAGSRRLAARSRRLAPPASAPPASRRGSRRPRRIPPARPAHSSPEAGDSGSAGAPAAASSRSGSTILGASVTPRSAGRRPRVTLPARTANAPGATRITCLAPWKKPTKTCKNLPKVRET